jgi:hypothetical protein
MAYSKVIQSDAWDPKAFSTVEPATVDMVFGFVPPFGSERNPSIAACQSPQDYADAIRELAVRIKPFLKKEGSMYLGFTDSRLKDGRLGQIPSLVRDALINSGWYVRNRVIVCGDDPLEPYTTVWFITANKRYYYSLDAIREPHTSVKDIGRSRMDTRTPKFDTYSKEAPLNPGGYLVQHGIGKNPSNITLEWNSATSVREPVPEDTLKRYQRAVNLGAHAIRGKRGLPETKNWPRKAPKAFLKLFGPDFDYSDKFDGGIVRVRQSRFNEMAREILHERVERNRNLFAGLAGKLTPEMEAEVMKKAGYVPPSRPNKEKGGRDVKAYDIGRTWRGEQAGYHEMGKGADDMVNSARVKTADHASFSGDPNPTKRLPPEPSEGGAFHPMGKNGGDLLKGDLFHEQVEGVGSYHRSATDPGHQYETHSTDPLGPNPGDMQKWGTVPGQGAMSFARKKHSGYFAEDGTPLVQFEKGKNPGDVLEGQAFSYSREAKGEDRQSGGVVSFRNVVPPRDAEHEIGKNPSDVVREWKGTPESQPNRRNPQMPKKVGQMGYAAVGKSGEDFIAQNAPNRGNRDERDPEAFIARINHNRSTHYTHELGRNPRDFLDIPPLVAVKPILSSCPPYGLVLDPFAGFGTIALVARVLERNSISIEFDAELVELLRERLKSPLAATVV